MEFSEQGMKAVVYLSGTTANIAGLLNCIVATALIKEPGITLYRVSIAVLFIAFEIIITLTRSCLVCGSSEETQ